MESLANLLVDIFNLQNTGQGYDVMAYSGIAAVIAATAAVLLRKNKKLSPPTEEQVVPPTEATPVVTAKEEVPEVSWKSRLFSGLSKTRQDIWGKVGSILTGEQSDEKYERVEEILYTSDISPTLVSELLEHLKKHTRADTQSADAYLKVIHDFLKGKMSGIQSKVNPELYDIKHTSTVLPKVIMIVGVNGAGKTTTIGKLATKLKTQGATVVVGACDTFRAAAVEQLQVWCQRAGVEMVRALEGADPSGVAFDAVKRAKEIGADYCIIDTAGRLHTKSNLMDELIKTKKVMSKVIPDAPHETLLVVDAITGQNAIRQAEEFHKALNLSGLIFTKCDGSAKAGSAVGIVQKLEVPIVYIGVGESVDDLNIFNLDDYLGALLGA